METSGSDSLCSPRPVSAVVLRGGAERLEVLMVQRTPKARFMGGAWVFPGGSVDAVSDDEIRAGIRLLAETTGIFTETAGGVTTATLAKLAERGDIGKDERVVVFITGEGLKTLDAVRGAQIAMCDGDDRWKARVTPEVANYIEKYQIYN